ncbi:MAG: tRNA lysidine(34) synthetase TilS [Planctomycetota bacterium]|nr:MAG: tRNA lysidine(34) synthetase TilS [Planctomycetota bacterium]
MSLLGSTVNSSVVRTLTAALDGWPSPPRVWLIAVSGGADSVALLHACREVQSVASSHLHVLHVDHQLREESATDAAWVAELCAKYDLPCTIERAATDLRQTSEGLEEAARELRLASYERVARNIGAEVVLLAHTADDQAETVLHHMTRGTGLRGLAGIPLSRPLADGIQLWRPLLTMRRSALRDYLKGLGQEFREDHSNRDESLTRNRLRHTVLPLLEKACNPQVIEALCRLAEQANETQAWLKDEAQRGLTHVILDRTPEQVRFHCEALAPWAPVLIRECFVQLWTEQGWPRQGMTAAHWRSLYEMTQEWGPAARDLPGGCTARRRAGLLMLTGPAKFR